MQGYRPLRSLPSQKGYRNGAFLCAPNPDAHPGNYPLKAYILYLIIAEGCNILKRLID